MRLKFLFFAVAVGSRPAGIPAVEPPSERTEEPVPPLLSARKGFVSELRVRGPAPQKFENRKPPDGVTEVEFASGDLTLKGWLSTRAHRGPKRPAVVCLHGGFAFDADQWEYAKVFVEAGFVLFMPILRGENGNPGRYESFLGEVDDVLRFRELADR